MLSLPSTNNNMGQKRKVGTKKLPFISNFIYKYARGVYMKKDNPNEWDKFIGRLSNFHLDKGFIAEIAEEYSDLFGLSHEICKELKLEIDDKGESSSQDREELLELIFTTISDFVFSNMEDEFKKFKSFAEYCPNYLEALKEDCEEILQANGVKLDRATEHLNLHVYLTVYNACLFTALLYYIDSSTRVESLSLREMTYRHSLLKFSDEDSKYYLKSPKFVVSEGGATDNKLEKHSKLDKETYNLKQRRNRSGLKSPKPRVRKKWHGIPLHNEYMEAIICYAVDGPKDAFIKNMISANKQYAEVQEIWQSPRDDEYKAKIYVACGKPPRTRYNYPQSKV